MYKLQGKNCKQYAVNQSKYNVLQLCDINSTRVKSSEISETFTKASFLHSAAVNNLHNDHNRFTGARIIDNTSRTIRSGGDEESKGFLR